MTGENTDDGCRPDDRAAGAGNLVGQRRNARAHGQVAIALMVLHGVPHFMGGNCDRRQGLTLEVVRAEPHGFVGWVVMITQLRLFHGNTRQPELVHQMFGQLATSAGHAGDRRIVLGHDPLHPNRRAKNHHHDHDGEDKPGHRC